MRPIALATALLLAVPAIALAQRTRPVSTDESVTAPDALIRVRELAGSDNVGEAVRVLQMQLESQGDRLLPLESDPEVFVSVRRVVHAMLLHEPTLLARYRTAEGPRADELLARGELATLEQTRLLTPAGFEAALRLAQLDLESARFEAARLMLEQLEDHPERRAPGRGRAEAAALAVTTASFLPRESTTRWAQRWASEAGLPAGVPTSLTPPPGALARSRSTLDRQPALPSSQLPGRPLQQVAADSRAADGADDNPDRVPWVFPAVVEGVVYVNDGERVSAWDSTTLAPLWQSDAPVASGRSRAEAMFALTGLQGWSEDAAVATVANGVVVAPMGSPENGLRRGERRVQAFDAGPGRLLWAIDPAELDTQLDEAVVRGPALIDGDTVVLSLRKASAIRRTSVLFLVGVDLYTGRERWIRLVGSVGTNPWGRSQVRPDGATLHEGVVYRGDDMGVVGAYEAATGRPVWVRITRAQRGFDMNAMRSITGIPPYEMQTPVVAAGDLYFIEPGRERVLRLALADGRILGARDSTALGDPRYLLPRGADLLAVSPNRIQSIPLADFAQGQATSVGPVYTGGGIKGRVVVHGEGLIVPVEGGLSLLGPAGSAEQRLPLPTTGNVVVAAADGEGSDLHLLVNDTRQLSSYVSWDQAQRLLDRRVAQAPRDVRPLLTYVELLHRSGHAERVPELTDAALKLLNRPGESGERGDLAAHRERLFDLLITMVRGARVPTASSPSPPIRDAALLDAIVARLPACAQTPSQQAAQCLELAWLRELQGRADQAVESYQQVLLDESLALAPPWRQPDTPAGQLAASALATLLKRVGPGPYAAFDQEAAAQAAELRDATPAALTALARRYPAAAVTPELWHRAAEAHARAGDRPGARLSAGLGLSAAELSVAIGRADQGPVIGRLAGSLLTYATSPADTGSLYRTLRRLAQQHPDLALETARGVTPIQSAADAAAATLAGRGSLPLLGAQVASGGQVIEGWLPLVPLVQHATGASTDSVLMISERAQEAGLWAPAAEDGRLHQVWSRPAKVPPTVIRVGFDQALLFWPSARGGSLECVGIDGSTRWRSPEFLGLFEALPEYDPNDRIPTPLEGHVRPESIVLSMDESSIVLVQRTGFAAAFDLASGRVLWRKPLELQRVYDVCHVGGTLVVSGALRALDGQLGPGVLTFAAATGEPRSRLPGSVLGDHPRWVRALPGGDALVATSEGLVRFDPMTGNARWTTRSDDLRASTDGWIVGDSAMVLDAELRLWHVALEGGAVSPTPVESRDKLTLPVSGVVDHDHLILSTSQGVLIVDASGRVLGSDSLDSGQLDPALVAQGLLVTVESPQADTGLGESISPYRLVILESPSARVLSAERLKLFESPGSLTLLDGKVLIGQGVATIVLDAPPNERP